MSLGKPRLLRKAGAKSAEASDTDKPLPESSPQPVQSAWTEDRRLSSIVLLVLALLAGYLTYILLRPFLKALCIAVILAIAAAPLHRWVSRKIRSPRRAAMVTMLVATVAVLIPLSLISIRITMEASTNYRSFLDRISNTATWPSRVDPLIEGVAEQVGTSPAQLKSQAGQYLRAAQRYLIAVAGTAAQRLGQQLLTLLIGVTFLYPLLRGAPELRASALCLLPLSPERASELARVVKQGVIANVYGMLAVGVAEGILVAIGFRLNGLPTPLLWGTIATILSFLPYVGVTLVWGGGVVYLLLREQWFNAVFLAIWGVILVSAADGFIRGRVISHRVKTNSLMITLSLMGGLAVFGAIGLFVGPVTIVVLASLLRMLREEHTVAQQSRN